MHQRWTFGILAICVCLALHGTTSSQTIAFGNAEIEFFENRIRPVLVEHCFECHGDDDVKVRGGLRMTSRASMLAGGDSGPAVVPGDVEASLLISSLAYEDFEMPPQGQLPPQIIADFRKWIEMGAPDPRDGTAVQPDAPADIVAAKSFWAFQPVQQTSPPCDLIQEDWPKTDIDRFILQHLEAANIVPRPDASRASLLRRVHVALTGLPPSPDEINRFTDSDRSLDEDLAQVVDGLLDSPHFGERWGRHWLDVARFAESSGGGRSLMFPDAWRYRDYVIDSFNADKPFDQFVREQLAGDLLSFDSFAQQYEQIVATGFLALGPTNYEQQDKELLRMEVIDEQVDTVGRAFLALTLGCARCHDHKFDPIPMRDYYALAGIFHSTKSLVDGNVSGYVKRVLATDEEKAVAAEYESNVARLTKRLAEARQNIQQLGGELDSAAGLKKRLAIEGLEGIVVDNTAAKLKGTWKKSVVVPRFVGTGYVHDDGQPKGNNLAVFEPQLEMGGQYEVRLAYSAGGNRASNVPVTIIHQDGTEKKIVNQSVTPNINGVFVSLGIFRFEANNVASITVSNAGTDGVVIVDAVQLIPREANDEEAGIEPSSRIGTPVEQTNAAVDPSDRQSSGQLAAAKTRYLALERELQTLKQNPPKLGAIVMSVEEQAEPGDGHLHIRGSVRNLGEKVPRGFIQVLCRDDAVTEIPAEASGRLQLANWIADVENPLTSRVYVNRVWRHLFGRGLVETTDNFGKMGQLPSHPKLLDYLASRFVEEGWSTKRLIRHILLSRVFRLQSASEDAADKVDPENRLLWRAPRRRLDAEVLRDSILSVSGQLDLTRGGLTIRKITQYDLGYEFKTRRRSIYVPAFRNSMLDLFEVFDIANPNLVTGHRNTSTLPTQALYLMNNPWVLEQSRRSATELLNGSETHGRSDLEMLQLAYLKVVGRAPTETEEALTMEHLHQFEDDEQAWTSVFHALFASLDFRYLN
jgi:hypothetical protein